MSIKRLPTIDLRSGYFVDHLSFTTKLSRSRIENDIRINQYDRYGLKSPSSETVKDYFDLQRGVAFDPRPDKRNIPPWLLAAELQYPGCAYRFFHPIFDLLFGQAESSAFWQAHLSKIPDEWIVEVEQSGLSGLASEWRTHNHSLLHRAHRTKRVRLLDNLSLYHLSLLKLPEALSTCLFAFNTHTKQFERRYQPANTELRKAYDTPGLCGLAGLIALTGEGCEIGDKYRYRFGKRLIKLKLPTLPLLPGCRRISTALSNHIQHWLEHHALPRTYNSHPWSALGLPTSWHYFLSTPFSTR